MSKLSEYLNACDGYDANGLPACNSQIAFGFSPFQVASTENIADVTTLTTVCKTDAVVSIKIIDDIAMVTFDFSNDVQTLTDVIGEIEQYVAQRDHVTETMNEFRAQLELAHRNEDVEKTEEISLQLRSLSIPFMLPTIMPLCYGGSVQVSFSDDPKFTFFTSPKLSQVPYQITMIFDAHSIFAQDEVAIYTSDPEAEIRAQQEEMWYLDEQRRAEEEAYFAQYSQVSDPYADDGKNATNNKLKGVRVK